ncbi:hypothetical protein SY83_16535 [Paenibacillus swuensis]|uniref:Uncharacterized protein n=1 Tax=Paenibacillus swuensis TaxID=1178515 RepID=A0A172TL38_9BACL|nr:DUF6483 family protein [Paenibacillus swuensis]ANE47624.1 hypothetical protein SY83_16535 [Paenibacillus swuensis]
MYQRDYMLRLIEQMTEALATRLLHLRKQNKHEEAMLWIDEQLLKLFLPKSRLLLSVSEEHCRKVMSVNGVPEADKMYAAALLLQHQADLYGDTGQLDNQYEAWRKSLYLFLSAAEEGYNPSGITVQSIRELAETLKRSGIALPAATDTMLFHYFVRNDRYDAAEDVLYRLPGKGAENWYSLGMNFYSQLSGYTDAQLLKGNLAREEVDAGQREWIQTYQHTNAPLEAHRHLREDEE